MSDIQKMIGKITFNINNNQIMALTQEEHDGVTILYTGGKNGREDKEETSWAISPGDMVMLMNYYRYKKDKGEDIF